MKTTTLAAIAALLAGPAFAQSSTNSATAESYSQSGVHNEGDRVNNRSGSAVAPSVNSTAPCVVGQSFGIAVAGTGLAAGGGRIDKDCVTRKEAQILSEIAAMRGTPRIAAITHLAANNERMKRTMIALGWVRTR